MRSSSSLFSRLFLGIVATLLDILTKILMKIYNDLRPKTQ